VAQRAEELGFHRVAARSSAASLDTVTGKCSARWASFATSNAAPTSWPPSPKSYEPFLHVERAELARLTGDDAARKS